MQKEKENIEPTWPNGLLSCKCQLTLRRCVSRNTCIRCAVLTSTAVKTRVIRNIGRWNIQHVSDISIQSTLDISRCHITSYYIRLDDDSGTIQVRFETRKRRQYLGITVELRVSFVCSLGKYDPNMSRMHFSLFLISGFNDGVDLAIITM